MYPNAFSELVELRTPAVGQPATHKITGEFFTRLDFSIFTYVAGPTVASRFEAVEILNGDNEVVFRVTSSSTLAAGATRRTSVCYQIGALVAAAPGEQLLPFPNTLLPPGFSYRFTATGIQADDQISSAALYLLRVPSGAWVPSPGSAPYLS